MKRALALLTIVYFGCINLAIAKPVIDCKDIGYWAAEVTLQKSKGASLEETERVFDLRQNMDPIEKELLIKMAKDVYSNNENMDKDTANDFYREQCEASLEIAK